MLSLTLCSALVGITYGPLQYDFGTATSPVASGYTQVTPDTRFDRALGYGWLDGGITGVDRGAVDTVELRDFASSADATFAVALPAGVYTVKFITGDVGDASHELMAFTLQGGEPIPLSTKARQLVTRTVEVKVDARQTLTLRIQATGAKDAVATLESLTIEPKSVGMRIINAWPAVVTPPFDRLILTLNRPAGGAGFGVTTSSDPGFVVNSFVGPKGPVGPVSLIQVAPTRCDVMFPAQKAAGTYTLAIASRLLDQNGDGVAGTADDVFVYSVTIPPGPAVLYVAPAGNDNDLGTQANPLKTIATAVTKAADEGCTIYLRAGTYAGGFTVDKANTSLVAFPGELPSIVAPSDDAKVACTIVAAAPGLTIKGIEVVGGYYYAIKFEQSGGLLENLSIHDTGRDCVKIVPQADDVTIRRCEIFRSGLRESNADGIDNVNGDRMLVQDCYIHDVVGYGVFGKGGATGVVIERNIVMNAAAGIYLGGFTDTEFFDAVANPQLFESIDCVVRNNTIVNTSYAGIGFAGALRGTAVSNNLLNTANVGQGAIYFAEVAHDIPGKASLPAPTTNCVVKTNTVRRIRPGTRFAVYIGSDSMGDNNVIDLNVYDNGGLPPLFVDGRNWRTESNWIRTFDEWRSRSGFDASSSLNNPNTAP